jgi:hypothetical protein
MGAGMLGTHAEDHLAAFPLDILGHTIPLWRCCRHLFVGFRVSPVQPGSQHITPLRSVRNSRQARSGTDLLALPTVKTAGHQL